jgi:nickel/cobalt exporter
MLAEALPLLLLGFGLGLMHALDADHIMAISTLSNYQPGLKKTLFHSLHWAIGHGGVLLVSGLLLFGLGVSIPESLQQLAEMSVGVLLIVLGLLCFVQFRREKIRLEIHTHNDIVHTHWHDNSDDHNRNNIHKPVFIGVLHGLAGSAPALALFPAVASGQFFSAMIYLLLFSLGVMLSMLAFGLGFAHVQRFLNNRYQQVFQFSRHFLAFSSIGFGSYWLAQTV